MSIERWTLITLLVLPVGLTFAQLSETKRVEPQKAVLADSQEPSTRLTLAPGLRATLWAAEPQLANPVALSFDAQGRLYVAETYRYGTSALDVDDHPGLFDRDLALRTTEERSALLQEMFGDQAGRLAGESERVRLVEDTDGDGKADRSRIFAEGFNGPFDGVAGGILAERNQVWFASNPSLWKMGDVHADSKTTREEILHGFGVHVGSPTHGLNGMIFGPDGMLYFAVGDRGADLTRKDGSKLTLADGGAVFRCHPDGSRLEVFATGLRNPRDLAFDEFGNLFTTDSARGDGDRSRFIYLIDGSDSGWRVGYENAPLQTMNPWAASERWKSRSENQLAYVLPSVATIAKYPLGMVYQPGGGLGAGYRGTFFVCHAGDGPADGSIRTYTLKPEGAGFQLSHSALLLRGVLPTDVTFGPDSRLYFSDWVSKWPWPKSGRGRIYAVDTADGGGDRAALDQTKDLISKGMKDVASEKLGVLLGHADQRVRLDAQFELARRGRESLTLFQKVAEDTSAAQLARIHALWGAGQLADQVPAALNHLQRLLKDSDSEVRAQSAKMLGEHARFEAFTPLVAALKDSAPRVAFFAAQSLGKLKRPEAIPALIELLRRKDDRDVMLRHALVIALERLGPDEALGKTIHDPSRAVRLGGVLAYRRLADPAVAAFLEDFDVDLVREAALAINDGPIDAAMPALAAILEQAPLDDEPLILRAINAQFRLGQPENARTLTRFANRSYVPASFRAEAINRLAQWANPPTRDRITGMNRPVEARDAEPAREALTEFLSQLAGRAPEEVQVATINAVAALEVPGTGHALWDVVFQTAHPVRSRIAALQALERVQDLRLEVAVQHAVRSNQAELRSSAIPILSRLHPAVSAPMLKILVSHGTAAEQRAVFSVLGKMSDSRADEIIIASLHGLRAGKVAPAAQAELLETAAGRESAEVAEVLMQIQAEWQRSGDPLALYRVSLDSGDPVKGQRLFERHPRLACIRCHEEAGDAEDSGPSLLRNEKLRSPTKILEALVNHPPAPSALVETLSPTELQDLVAYLADLGKRSKHDARF